MTAIYALTICLILYAIGEFVSVKTKGLLSMVFVLCVVMLIGFWCGMPTDIVSTAGLSTLGSVFLTIMVAGVGTTMDIPELICQWKTVIISFVGCAVGVIIIILVGGLIIGRDAALASAPIFAGASVALAVINAALEDLNLTTTLGPIVIMIFALQKFIGVPLCSFCLNREATAFLKDPKLVEHYANSKSEDGANAKKRPLAFLCGNTKPVYNMMKLALIGSLSTAVSNLTGGTLNSAILALIFSVILTELGFLPQNIFGKLDCYFMILFAVLMSVFSSLATVTPQSLLASLFPVALVLILGAIGTILTAFVTARIFKKSVYLNIALAITCTFGFPTTALISEEIATSVGQTDLEKQGLRNYLLPQMTVAGFVTVTIGSVILAGAVVPFLGA